MPFTMYYPRIVIVYTHMNSTQHVTKKDFFPSKYRPYNAKLNLI